jgi:Skp family chaperone for outer membrane proteins
MKKLKSAAAVCLAASVVIWFACIGGNFAQAQTETHHARRRANTPAKPSVEDQIEQLRQQMQSQIDELKQELGNKDAQLQQAQQAAAAAQAAADKAQAAADQQQQAVSENTSAVNTLQSNVNDLKSSSSSLESSFTSVKKDTAEIKKAVTNPDTIHYHGITISPAGSFIAAETVWRQGAMGDGLNTHFSAVPLANSDNAQISEWQGSGRQSRIAIKAIGDAGPFTMTGYYEMDWLSSGTTSNNNQSNSYTVRQRQLWADAGMKNGWDFSGGQGWSLATETTNLLHRGSEVLPDSIDPQYMAGFVWTRQYSFRVAKDFGKTFAFGVAAENAEMLDPAGANLPSNLFYGTVGDGGGLYDNQAHYSFNATPDFVAKMSLQPGWGHFELFGIGRSFRDRLYPAGGSPSNNTVWGGGIGGGFRGPLANKHVVIGAKGLWGGGMGRYGSSTIADVTLRPDGTLSPLHAVSGIGTLQILPNAKLLLYLNYGGDYVGRDFTVDPVSGKQVGYGTYTTDMSGCNVEPAPGGTLSPSGPAHCGGNTKDVQELSAGWWYNIYKGEKGNLRYGIQYARFQRDLWSGDGTNSTTGVTTNPGGGANGVDNMFWTSFRYYLP